LLVYHLSSLETLGHATDHDVEVARLLLRLRNAVVESERFSDARELLSCQLASP
jgi:hypothetical protein